MASQNWESLLNPDSLAGTGPGALFTESATAAVLSPQTSAANQDYAVVNGPGQYLGWKVPFLLKVTANGFVTTNTTTGTLTFSLRANKNNATAVASNVVLIQPVGITTGATAITGIQWFMEAWIRCTGIASSGNTVSSMGYLKLGNSGAALPANPIALTATPGMLLPMPNASGETTAAVDTTQPQGIQLAATATAASGSCQCSQWLVEALN